MLDKTFSSKNYLHDEVVLLQLILDVYLKMLETFSPTKILLKQSSSKNLSFILDEIKDAIITIGGKAKRPPVSIPWKSEVGLIEKIEEFSYALVINSQSHNPTFLTLHQDIQEAKLLAKNFVLTIELWDFQGSCFCETVNPKHMHQQLEELSDHITKIADSLSEALQFSSKKEHILLFLLRKHDKIVELLGTTFIVKTCNGLFPSGTNSAKMKVTKAFASKGYDEIQDEINFLFSQLEDKSK